MAGGGGGSIMKGQREVCYVRRQCTPIHCLCNAYLGCAYPCY